MRVKKFVFSFSQVESGSTAPIAMCTVESALNKFFSLFRGDEDAFSGNRIYVCAR